MNAVQGRVRGRDRSRARSPTRSTGADVFIGLSAGGIVTQDMVKVDGARTRSSSRMANPTRRSATRRRWRRGRTSIMATGRSDYPEPGQQRPRLSVHLPRRARRARATTINEEMKLAAVARARRRWRRRTCPTPCSRAYGGERIPFGREYLIPKPFDYRVLLWVAPAVARGRDETGRRAAADRRTTTPTAGASRACSARSRGLMHDVLRTRAAGSEADRVPRGRAGEDHPRGARSSSTRGSADPILLVRREEIGDARSRATTSTMSKITIIDINRSRELRRRTRSASTSCASATASPSPTPRRILNSRNYYALMMLDAGDADGVIAGLRVLPRHDPAGAADRRHAPGRRSASPAPTC